MKSILWLLTGGTFSCESSVNGLYPAADNAQAGKMLSRISAAANVSPALLMNIDSTNMTAQHMRCIAEAADSGIKKGFDGIVITHGTDTMAYTSAFLCQSLESPPIPVILTGSQKPFFAECSDAPKNLENALAAACDERFRGVHILFGDKVLRGDSAHKEYSMSENAFISPDGYAAVIKNGTFINVDPLPGGKYAYHRDFSEMAAVIKLSPLTRPEDISLAVSSGIKGVVLEGYGCGGVPERLLPEIKAAADRGVLFLLVSQCFYEGVDTHIYEVGEKAARCGIIPGGKMTAEAALAKLMFMI